MEISLDRYFLQAFGYSPPAFKPVVQPVQGDVVNKQKRLGKHGSLYYQDNDTAVFTPIEVVVGNGYVSNTKTSYAQALGVTGGTGQYTGRWWLPNPVLSADLVAHVIDTELTERNGMVSELINLSGYRVKVRGLLVNTLANEFPEDDYDTLTRLVSLNAPITLNSVRTDILFMNSGNAQKLVTIRGLHFPERPGVKHVQPYELDMVTEMPFNLVDIS